MTYEDDKHVKNPNEKKRILNKVDYFVFPRPVFTGMQIPMTLIFTYFELNLNFL